MTRLVLALFAAVFLSVDKPAFAQEIRPCESFYFSDEAPPQLVELGAYSNDCYAYVSADARHIVVYPRHWTAAPDPIFLQMLEDSLAALIKSREELTRYGSLEKDLILVISEIYDPERRALAQNPAAELSCWSIVFRNAWDADREAYQQTIAHEASHCLFLEAVAERFVGNIWWNEGAAEYFSNVVYPSVNKEHGFVAAYDTGAALVDQDHESVLFFQHYANTQGGPESVLALMRRLEPAAAENETRAVLAALAGFDSDFHDFGWAVLRGAVADPGGGTMPYTQVSNFEERIYKGDEGAFTDAIATEPLHIKPVWIHLEPGYDYRLSAPRTTTGGRLTISYDAVGADPQPFDREIVLEGACGERKSYAFFATSIDATSEERRVEYAVTPEEMSLADCPCEGGVSPLDACMIGSWRFDKESLEKLLIGKRLPLEMQEPGFEWRIEVHEDNLVISEPNDFKASGRVRSSAEFWDDGVRGEALLVGRTNAHGKVCTNRQDKRVNFVISRYQTTDLGSYVEVRDGDETFQMPMPLTEVGGNIETGFLSYQCGSDAMTLIGEIDRVSVTIFLTRQSP